MAALAALATFFFTHTPPGFWNKLMAVGSAVCHQDPAHSFLVYSQQMPLCARCTGMYLGALLSLAFHFLQGKQGSLPPRKMVIPLGLLFFAFAVDGLNSWAASLGTGWNFYETTNLTRLVTGTGAGLVIGAVLAPIFNQTAWASWVSICFTKWQKARRAAGCCSGDHLSGLRRPASFALPCRNSFGSWCDGGALLGLYHFGANHPEA